MSDFTLLRNKMYVFRIQFPDCENNPFINMIGLQSDCLKDKKGVWSNKLSFRFTNLEEVGGCGIDEIIRGSKEEISKCFYFELRVWAKGKVL